MDIKYQINKRLGINKFFPSTTKDNLIALYDTSIGSLNVGDEIINDSARYELSTIFPYEQFLKSSTHDGPTSKSIYNFNNAKHRVLCGSNILNGKSLLITQWNIGLFDVIRMKDIVTLGVGWSNYEDKTSICTSVLYRAIFGSAYIHSVRDEYTKRKLESIGINNVINTSCPTMWRLTKLHCSKIPKQKSRDVVFTLTDYRRDYDSDIFLIESLNRNYTNVSIWIQGSDDLAYFNQLNVDKSKINIIPPKLIAYDEFLDTNDVDFVGTRLHAGIRALQKRKRSIIIGVDNRAREKKKDFNLEVIDRQEIRNELQDKINSELEMKICIPEENIMLWKKQFEKF